MKPHRTLSLLLALGALAVGLGSCRGISMGARGDVPAPEEPQAMELDETQPGE